jgi:predicted dehydrogenase
MGLVGGGRGFIGKTHVLAATMDGRASLVAGVFASDPARSRDAGEAFGVAPDRIYGSYREMVERESALPAGERIDFVTVATPNDTHYEIVRAFAEAKFHIVCEKPMTLTLRQAEELAGVVRGSGVVFAMAHGYTGYPLVRRAREMIRSGTLGTIRAVRTSYLQGWLRQPMSDEQRARRAWKLDPTRTGPSGCLGDIGIHAYQMIRYLNPQAPVAVSAHLRSFERAGPLDDYGTAILTFTDGLIASVTASRISHGRENDLRFEVDGRDGSLEWRQEEPNAMWYRVGGRPHALLTRDPTDPSTSEDVRATCRLPRGHPEGLVEAFANLYTSAFSDMIAQSAGSYEGCSNGLYPDLADGVSGMAFVEGCVESASKGGAWVSLEAGWDRRISSGPTKSRD